MNAELLLGICTVVMLLLLKYIIWILLPPIVPINWYEKPKVRLQPEKYNQLSEEAVVKEELT